MRDYSITNKPGEWYDAQVVDKYGTKYQNYFETELECEEWIYYIFENEKPPLTKEQESTLLNRAIQDCKEIDKIKLIAAILWWVDG